MQDEQRDDRRRGADDLARPPARGRRARRGPLEPAHRHLRRRRGAARADAGLRGAPRRAHPAGLGHDRDGPARLGRPAAAARRRAGRRRGVALPRHRRAGAAVRRGARGRARTGEVLPRDGERDGELEVRGPWVATGYLGVDAPEKFHDGWLRTGDIASIDAEGYIRITDRAKDVIKSGGEWISSVELEKELIAHPDVARGRGHRAARRALDRAPAGVRRPARRRGVRRGGAARAPRGPRREVVAARRLRVHRRGARRPAPASTTRSSCARVSPTASSARSRRPALESVEKSAAQAHRVLRRAPHAAPVQPQAQREEDDVARFPRVAPGELAHRGRAGRARVVVEVQRAGARVMLKFASMYARSVSRASDARAGRRNRAADRARPR